MIFIDSARCRFGIKTKSQLLKWCWLTLSVGGHTGLKKPNMHLVLRCKKRPLEKPCSKTLEKLREVPTHTAVAEACQLGCPGLNWTHHPAMRE